MKTIHRLLVYSLSLSLSMALTACNQTSTKLAPSDNISNVVSQKPQDGRVASQQLLTQYSGAVFKEYKIFYWSNGVKAEALLTEPTKPGRYPLLVNLHGGNITVGPLHSSFGYTAEQAYALANPNIVTLYPEYEGYMESQGVVHGFKTDLLDIENAIAVAQSFNEVASHNTYVLGYSLGGGLALMTAAADHEVRVVVAVSPAVGLTDLVSWAKVNNKSLLNLIETAYGSQPSAYSERSPDISKIQAPVLLLQGTDDQKVPWQTVQTFYKQMKEARKTVKFVLYPGGHHGLHDTYASQSTHEIDAWFQKYGLDNFHA